MTIQLNTDKNISGNERLEKYLDTKIKENLSRFTDTITRIEMHLSDENGSKDGLKDKRCLLEARMEGEQPIAVTSYSNTVENSMNEAIDKLKIILETKTGKLRNY